MFRAKLLIPLVLFLAYLGLEGAYHIGKRIAPPYPDMKKADVSGVVALTKGRTNYQLYSMDADEGGTLCANFFGTLSGKTGKLPMLHYGIISAEDGEIFVKSEASVHNFQKLLTSCVEQEHAVFQRRRFCMVRKKIHQGGRYYLLVSNTSPTQLKAEKLFFFVTSTKAKMRTFWPYALLFLRNFVIACLILFFAFRLYENAGFFRRSAVVVISCGLLAFIICATPLNVVHSAMYGPLSRTLFSQKVEKELNSDSTVVKIPLDGCSPYSAALLTVKGRAGDSSVPALIYTDLYKAPSYDDSQTEFLLSFFGDGVREHIVAFDTVHSFQDELSLRFWHEGRGESAVIESVNLVEAKLPPILIKNILGFALFLLPCFWVVWAAFVVTFIFLAVYFRRDIYSKVAAAVLTLAALVILVAPVYSFGHPEPMVQTTDDRWLMGLKPMSFYSLLWRNEPKPDITPEELETPVAGSLTVASFSDHVLAARGELYPDNNDTFQRFFTRFFSNIRMSVRREMVVLRDLRLVRLNSAYLMLRMIAWLWLIALIMGSLYYAFRLIFKGGKA